jgi:hypothetical protein
MTARWWRSHAVPVTVVGLLMGAFGDALQGWDGPGPLIFAALAIIVASVRWRVTPAVAVVVSAFFVVGALVNPESTQRLSNSSDIVGFGSGWLQLLGFVVAIVGGIVAVAAPSAPRPVRRERQRQ